MTETHPHSRVRMLLVEDSPDDAELMIQALHEGPLLVHVDCVEDGEAALDYLYQRGEFERADRPDLVLLDLYLPKKNGHEVLAEIKNDPKLRQIPVVLLSSSDDENDYLDAENLHVNCSVSKPLDHEEFAQTVEKIKQFWTNTASRPRHRG